MIEYPRVTGYRVELPDEHLSAQFTEGSELHLTVDKLGPSITVNNGIIGKSNKTESRPPKGCATG